MQDIVRKPAGSDVPQSASAALSQAKVAPAPAPSLRKGMERILDLSTGILDYLQRWSDHGTPQQIVHPALGTATEQDSSATLEPPRRHTPKKHRRRLHAHTQNLKTAVHKVTRHLKTPIGKLAVLQGATIALVMALLVAVYADKPTAAIATSNTGQGSNELRRYLPRAGEYVPPQPFVERLADLPQPLAQQAWITPWNTKEIAQNAGRYQALSAFWLTAQPDGTSFQTKADWSVWKEYLAANKKDGQRYFLTVSGDPDNTFLAMSDPQKRTRHIDGLLQLVKDNGFDGVDIDYEGLGRENRGLFTEFIRALGDRFKADQKLVAVTVEARIGSEPPMDWFALAQVADQIRIMAYDYHSRSTGFPGPVAPIGWIQEVLDYGQKTVPNDKLVIGLGNYGYDWTKPADEHASWDGVGISYDQAMAIAKEKQLAVTRATGIDDRGYDLGSIPMLAYADEQGRQHSAWFEDQESLQAKVDLVSRYRTAGIIFWSVGLGDSNFWNQ